MRKPRYEITGEWSGPRNPAGNYTRECYRTTTRSERMIAWVKRTHGITFTDGTKLYLRARLLEKGERGGKPLRGYAPLIEDCLFYDVTSVADLDAARESYRTENAR